MRQLASTLLTGKDQEVSSHLLFLGLPKPSSVSAERAPDPKFCPGLASQLHAATFWTQRLGCSVWGGRREEGEDLHVSVGGMGPLWQMKGGTSRKVPNWQHWPSSASSWLLPFSSTRKEAWGTGRYRTQGSQILTLRPCSLPRERQEQLMGYRKRGPKPKPLVVQVNTLGSQHKPFPGPCFPNYLQFLEGAPQLHLISYRTPGPTPYDAISTCGSWSISDVPGML